MKIMKIDPSVELHDLPLFRFTAIGGVVFAMITSAILCPRLPRSSDGYENLNTLIFEVLKVPSASIAVTLSLLVIIGTMHRSALTLKQIKISSRQIQISSEQIKISLNQNNFSNYYKHLEEFEKYIKNSKELTALFNFKSIKKVHDSVWPNFFENEYGISEKLIDETNHLFSQICELARNSDNYTVDGQKHAEHLFWILEKYQLTYIESNGRQITRLGDGGEDAYKKSILKSSELAAYIKNIISFETTIEKQHELLNKDFMDVMSYREHVDKWHFTEHFKSRA